MKKPKKISKRVKSLVAITRTWFDRVYGNTYYSGVMLADGLVVACIDCQPGSEPEYNLLDKMDKEGILPFPREHYQHGGGEAFWSYCERWGITHYHSNSSVAHKGHLFFSVNGQG